MIELWSVAYGVCFVVDQGDDFLGFFVGVVIIVGCVCWVCVWVFGS